MLRYFCIIVSRVKLENWHVYLWRLHVSARNKNIRWHDWDKLI